MKRFTPSYIAPKRPLTVDDLKKRGFTFVGTTIVYSLLQSAGLVDDHLKGCSWHASCRPPE